MPNRLAVSASPYLRQHADNPVAWWPWCDEAFAEARRRDVPVLVSIGYSTCHWCHVMAHECFEDAATAALMDGALVCIKVDREEHPEVDAIYMDAIQGLTGHGGWPLNAFTDHQGRPFHACTYLPRPRWAALVEHLGRLWREDRGRIEHAASEITAWLRRQEDAAGDGDPGDPERALADQLGRAFDEHDPGLAWNPQRAPKFPPSPLLRLLVDGGRPAELGRAERILEAMQDGGLHDRVGGGFHRYSVDAEWRVPHFEKMLYDNAQLMGVYARAAWRTGRADFLATALNAADYVLRDLRVEEAGVFRGYATAEDADDPGGEGSFYAWSPDQLAAVLGAEDGARLAAAWDLAPGEPELGASGHHEPVASHIPHPRGAGVPAGAAGQALRAGWEPQLPRLRRARDSRPRPGRDGKVLTDQNGLLLEGLSWVARLGGQPRHRLAAAELAALLRTRQGPAGLLRMPGRAAYVTDYGAAACGLLAAFDLLGDAGLVDAAGALLDEAEARLLAEDGGFHATPAGRADLVRRGREWHDGPAPAGQSQLAAAALRLFHLTGEVRRRARAEAVLAAAAGTIARQPLSSATLLQVRRERDAGPALAVVGGGAELLAACRSSGDARLAVLPLAALSGRAWPALAGIPARAAVHLCQGGTCRPAMTTVDQVRAALAP
ncbi:MAG: thioredoxin domain-containing protein [Planctomycetes bacterium]|nr:thioredoxin domain-containing protein [Planctomycetota bacterium]